MIQPRTVAPVGAARPPLGAVVGKELRTWSRDLVRIHFLTFALVYALTYTVLPIMIGSTDYLPMTGVFGLVVLAAGCSAHLHSSDGTALWQTLMTRASSGRTSAAASSPGCCSSARPAVALTVLGAVAHGEIEMVQWAAGLLPVTLGAGTGLMLLVSVYVPIRITDPHRRGSNPGQDGGALAGLVWLVLPFVALAAAPVITLLAIGRDDPLLQWAGTPAGIAIGALLAWGLGRWPTAAWPRRVPSCCEGRHGLTPYPVRG